MKDLSYHHGSEFSDGFGYALLILVCPMLIPFVYRAMKSLASSPLDELISWYCGFWTGILIVFMLVAIPVYLTLR